MKKNDQHIYRIIFYQENKRYDLYARNLVMNENMMGFVGIEGIIFNHTSGTIIDSAEEKLKAEFGDVTCAYIPYHNVVRIDEVKKAGKNRIVDVETVGQSNVVRPQAFNKIVLPTGQDT